MKPALLFFGLFEQERLDLWERQDFQEFRIGSDTSGQGGFQQAKICCNNHRSNGAAFTLKTKDKTRPSRSFYDHPSQPSAAYFDKLSTSPPVSHRVRWRGAQKTASIQSIFPQQKNGKMDLLGS